MTQRVALDSFLAEGFDQVTVEQIAERAGLTPSTVYRHFGTKEQLVLWDATDHEIAADLDRRLGQQPPLQALRDAFVATLAQHYQAEREFHLRRVSYIYATPALHAGAAKADLANRAAIAKALVGVLPADRQHLAPLIAGTALLALDLAIDTWQSQDGRTLLADHIERIFADLQSLAR
ncbi:MAG: TetR/AcrR family transcriptional regulator [Beutenbergiaceae bacterium]